MKKTLIWLNEMLSDERGAVSSKRVIGVTGSLCLFIALFVPQNSDISSTLVQTVGLLSAAALGLTSLDKWTHKPPVE